MNGLTKVYPNPADDFITIELISDNNNNVNVSLFDMTGKLVLSYSNYSFEENGSIYLNVKGLNEGVYFIQLVDEVGFRRVEKVIINH